MMILYDIWVNGHVVSLDDIIERQFLLSPISIDRYSILRQKEIYKFLKDFYSYCQDPQGKNQKSWIQWRCNTFSDKIKI
jgi:hypothetical protein